MKRYLLTISILLSAFVLGAQTMEDALTFSENEYCGTARSMALGNAVTAVGGDLGTIGINPAGSAVSAFSQFVVSPGLTVSSTRSAYAPSYKIDHVNPAESQSRVFGPAYRDSETRMHLPNIGASMRLDFDGAPLTAMTIAVVNNTTGCFLNRYSAGGKNGLSTMSGALAAFASSDGLPYNILSDRHRYSSGYNWNQIAAYDGGLINYNPVAKDYYGSAENVSYDSAESKYFYGLKGVLDQRSSIQTSGYKNDLVFNFGFDFGGSLFLGMNLGIPTIEYTYDEFFQESAASGRNDFVISPSYYGSDGNYHLLGETAFQSSQYEYMYTANVDGIYASVGAIWLPTSSIRLGASFRTPSLLTVEETYRSYVDTYFEDSKATAHSDTDLGEYSYNLRTPYSLDLGAAMTFGPFGMVSVDYELTDYSIMRYKDRSRSFGAGDNFGRVNDIIGKFCGVSHNLRAGAEVNILPMLSLRAGYSLRSSPKRICTDSAGNTVDAIFYDNNYSRYQQGIWTLNKGGKYQSDLVTSYCAGLGYKTSGSLYVDFAMKWCRYPVGEVNPYGCYIDDKNLTVAAPVVRTERALWDFVLTFGWRF